MKRWNEIPKSDRDDDDDDDDEDDDDDDDNDNTVIEGVHDDAEYAESTKLFQILIAEECRRE